MVGRARWQELLWGALPGPLPSLMCAGTRDPGLLHPLERPAEGWSMEASVNQTLADRLHLEVQHPVPVSVGELRRQRLDAFDRVVESERVSGGGADLQPGGLSPASVSSLAIQAAGEVSTIAVIPSASSSAAPGSSVPAAEPRDASSTSGAVPCVGSEVSVLFIRPSCSGKSYTLAGVDLSALLDVLKDQVECLTGVQPQYQVLLLRGRRLQGNQVVASYGVASGDTLFLEDRVSSEESGAPNEEPVSNAT